MGYQMSAIRVHPGASVDKRSLGVSLGYLFAFAAFAFIGSYMVPIRFAQARGSAFLPCMALGMLALEIFFLPELKALWANPAWFSASLLAGFLWAVGQALANDALEEVSLAKASVFFNVNSFINIAVGILVFHEASGGGTYALLLTGAVLLFLGAWTVAKVAAPPSKEGKLHKGILLSLLAGVMWGIYFAPVQAAQLVPVNLGEGGSEVVFTPLMALAGMVLGGAAPALLFGLWKSGGRMAAGDLGLGLVTAGLWMGGTLFFLKANSELGLARAVPIVNSNVLMYAGWSLLFKELSVGQWPKLFGGALMVVLGVVLMALSR
jgi:drug/metabolite transporter (DMT)-like permease